MPNRITIYTSIAPTIRRVVQGEEIGPAYQKACIDSWKEAGFRIVSLNCDFGDYCIKTARNWR